MRITYIRVRLITRSPLAVTAPELGASAIRSSDASAIDLPLRRDLTGRPVIPATAVAGNLRAALPEDLRETVMGMAGTDESGGSVAVPSPLYVLAVEVSDGAAVEHHHRTAIDRHRGAASSSTLHDLEAISAGTSITVRLELHVGDDQDLLADLLPVLQSWRPILGRGGSTGHGQLEVTEIKHASLELRTPAELLRYLEADGPAGHDELVDDGTTVALRSEAPQSLIRERFRIVDALHIGADKSESGPSPVLRDASGRAVVPGSSWKGVVRSRAEFLIRTLGGRACSDGRCGDCPTCALFGYGGGNSDDGSVGRKSAVAFLNTVIEHEAVAERTHVAIDRFTGGALDSALYSEEVIWSGEVELRVNPLHGSVPPWGRGLILAALIDLDDGLIGIGGSTTRGHGTLQSVNGRLADRAEFESTVHAIAVDALRDIVAAFPAKEAD